MGAALGLEDFEGEDDDENLGFDLGPEDRAEMEMEMFGMKRAIHEGGQQEENGDEEMDDEGVEELQSMMLKMQAVRGE